MEINEEYYCIPARVLIKAMFRDLESLAQSDNRQKNERKPRVDYHEVVRQLYDSDPFARIERDFWRALRLSP